MAGETSGVEGTVNNSAVLNVVTGGSGKLAQGLAAKVNPRKTKAADGIGRRHFTATVTIPIKGPCQPQQTFGQRGFLIIPPAQPDVRLCGACNPMIAHGEDARNLGPL